MIEKEIQIVNEQGLHARPATALVNLTQKFNSDIFLLSGEKKINAKSILGVLVLAAEKGSTLGIQAIGNDAEEAAAAICKLAENKFGMKEE